MTDLPKRPDITAAERHKIANAVNLHEQYLYQIFTARRVCPPEHATAIERATDGRITRQMLRPNDWAQIWPELANCSGRCAA